VDLELEVQADAVELAWRSLPVWVERSAEK
jgi:hypothetical protein